MLHPTPSDTQYLKYKTIKERRETPELILFQLIWIRPINPFFQAPSTRACIRYWQTL